MSLDPVNYVDLVSCDIRIASRFALSGWRKLERAAAKCVCVFNVYIFVWMLVCTKSIIMVLVSLFVCVLASVYALIGIRFSGMNFHSRIVNMSTEYFILILLNFLILKKSI